MAILMVKTPNGKLRRVELSKNQPLTIGAHSTSDVQLTEPGIEVMEARISWGKKQFEITSANPKGVKVNGEAVESAELKPGDVIRLGNTQLVFTTEELAKASLGGLSDSGPPDDSEIGLAPISDEIPVFQQPPESDPPEESSPTYSVKNPVQKKRPSSRKAVTEADSSTGEAPPALGGDQESLDEELQANVPMLTRGGGQSSESATEESPPAVPDVSPLERIRESLHASRQRPGEKELLRSPLVMGLTIGSFFLLVGAVVLWSVIGREEADRYLQRARQQAEQRKFQLAIDDYKKYLLDFPGDADHEAASRELSITQVRSKIDIGVPDWEAGLKELEDLIDRHRDEPEFERLHGEISQFAEQIAKGVCEQAGRDGDQELFNTSEEALTLVDRYTGDEKRRDRIQAEVQALRKAAERQIKKKTDYDTAFARMESGLKESKPFEILDARLELIQLHEDAETDPGVKKFLQQALDLEQSLVQQQREEKEAEAMPPVPNARVTTLAATSRLSKNELPSERPVYTHAADCLFGLDTNTGEPIWRHVTGWKLPFFPIEVLLEEPALLVYADRDRELQLLSRQTGQVIWSQSVPEGAVGTPIVVGTQAFLSTKSGLLQIDLSTGKRLGGLTFSQPLAAGPLLLPETQHGLLIGERELAYLIELNPPAIVDVLYLGHGPRSVATAPIRMGPLVLVAENISSESSRLRVFDTRQKTPELLEIEEASLSNETAEEDSENKESETEDQEASDTEVIFPIQVIDAPIIRGNQLLVPSTPERVTAFTVSAEAGQPALTKVSYYQVPNPRLTSTWLSAGPDGQVWMASSAVRRLHLTTESFEALPPPAAVGIATQPIQMLGEWMYVARRSFYGQAVQFSRLKASDFDDGSRVWRTSIGDAILSSTLNSSGELITVHDSGAVFRVKQSELTDEPFLLSANADVEIPDNLQIAPLTAKLSDGRFAMVWGGAEPKLSFIRSTGQVIKNDAEALPDEPQTAPVDLDAGIVVGLPGRLHLAGYRGRGDVKDFLLPVVEGRHAGWKSLTRLDGTHLLCVDDSGLMRRIEFREEPLHLAEAGNLAPEAPLVLPPLVTGNDRFVAATEAKQLLEVAADSLQILSSQTLSSVPTGAWKTGDSICLQLQNDTLVCLNDRDGLAEQWKVSLAKQTVAGQPLVQNETIIVPLAPHGVWVLKKESGEVVRKVETPGACSGDPMLIEGQVVIPLADGSLFLLPEPTEGERQL